MFVDQEKSLMQKNYIDNSHKNKDSNHLLSFFYKDDPDRQVNISIIDKKYKKYKVSFPMSENTIHYATHFDNLQQTKEYLDYLLETHL